MKSSLVLLLLTAVASAQPLRISEPHAVVSGPALFHARAAFGAGNYLIVWQDGFAGAGAVADICAARRKPGSLAALDPVPIPVCVAAEAQEAPAVAYGDGVFLIAWQDFRNGSDYDVRAVLLDAQTGKARGREFAVAARPGNQAEPAVASDGKTFLVVWQEAVAADAFGIRGIRISSSGEILDAAPHTYAREGTSPAAGGSGGRFLVTWSVREGRGATAAALVDPATGFVSRGLGTINSICSESTSIAAGPGGSFVTVSAREGYPNPWGWPGPGAVLASRVLGDGATPESGLDYGQRQSNVTARAVPNVVDTATWGRTSKTWDAGAVGGFPGTADGLWPNGWPAVTSAGENLYLFAWVKGVISKDRLSLTDFSIWLRGLDAAALAVRVPESRVAAGETKPVLVAGPPGETLLLTLRVGASMHAMVRTVGVERLRPTAPQ